MHAGVCLIRLVILVALVIVMALVMRMMRFAQNDAEAAIDQSRHVSRRNE
jgi:hypothetical protein